MGVPARPQLGRGRPQGDAGADAPPGPGAPGHNGDLASPTRTPLRASPSARLVFLGALFLVVILVGVSFVQGWGPFERPRRPRVAVMGDSLTAQSSWAIDRTLGAAGFDASVVGVNAATIDDLEPEIRSYVGYSGADVMVIALGTNNAVDASPDATRHISINRTKDDLHRVAGHALESDASSAFALSVKCLVWVTINDRAPFLDLDKHAPAVNQAIRDEADRRTREGHQMLVADWTARSQGHPEWFVTDGVHLTDHGQDAYGGLIRETVQRCQL